MTDEQALNMLRRRTSPLNINEAIELIEKKIEWRESCIAHSLPMVATQRVAVEQTTLKEALEIIKRVKKYPHDAFNIECNMDRHY